MQYDSHLLNLLNLSPPQREAAQRALLLAPQPPVDDAGNVRPMAALADLLRRLPELVSQYHASGIDDAVLRDTLSDVSIWMNTCHRRTGEWGMLEYHWLLHHFSFGLFKLGRLQFMPGPSSIPAHVYMDAQGNAVTLAKDGARFTQTNEADGTNGYKDPHAWTATLSITPQSVCGYPIGPDALACPAPVTLALPQWRPFLAPGGSVLDIHIPEGAPLTPAAVEASLARAPGFFAALLPTQSFQAFTCTSWMLDPSLPHIVPGSNLAHFQARFHCVPVPYGDSQMLERVFGPAAQAPVLTAGSTRLQQAIYAWYAAGKACRSAAGWIPLPQE